MTEEEWLNGADPTPMLDFLKGSVSDRKLRLFGVACCRRVWSNLTDPKARNALELAERAADGAGHRKQLGRALQDLTDIMGRLERTHGEFGYSYDHQWFPTQAVRHLFGPSGLAPVNHIRWIPDVISRFVWESSLSDYREHDVHTEQAAMSDLLREIFGNPFHPRAADTSWRTSTAVTLADAMCQAHAFDRMPILADALEDAGCDNADILTHCRGDGPHVRGCWVVDLILGRS